MSKKILLSVLSVGILSIGVTGVAFSTVLPNLSTSAQSNVASSDSPTPILNGEYGKMDLMGTFGEPDGLMGDKMGKAGKGKIGDKIGKIGSKMLESQATKYNIDSNLTNAVKTAQTQLKTDMTALKTAKDAKSDTTALEVKVKESAKALKTAMENFHKAVTTAKAEEAKTLGVDQTVIDNFVNGENQRNQVRQAIEDAWNNDATTVGQLKTLKDQQKTVFESARESQKAFNEAVKVKGGK